MRRAKHLSRRIISAVDMLIVVSDAAARSIRSAACVRGAEAVKLVLRKVLDCD